MLNISAQITSMIRTNGPDYGSRRGMLTSRTIAWNR